LAGQEQDAPPAQKAAAMTNADVVALVKAGLSAEVVAAKIQSSATAFDTSTEALKALKDAGVPDPIILAMLQSGRADALPARGRLKDELTVAFQRLKNTVVTVWSEVGHGTGFIFSPEGLIMTNQHVVGPSEYIAVQFDAKRKVPAVFLAASPEKDVAVLWANLSLMPEAQVAPLAKTDGAQPTAVEGERVLTIGSPLNQRKIMTTGIISKVEERAILSDININPGNSGGPLFNSLGEVIGITTFGERAAAGPGPGISGIVRIEEAQPVIDLARGKMAMVERPAVRLLPVEPSDAFPAEPLKSVAMQEKFDYKQYLLGIGDYQVTLLTPPMLKWIEMTPEREAAKTKGKRNKKEGAVQGTFRPFDQFYAWREYVGDYRPVLLVRATPELGESFWGTFGRGIAANYGVHVQAKLRFKTDFYKMRLKCGDKEVEPIQPGKIAHVLNESNYFVSVKDATFEGLYSYPADAINMSCGTVTVEIYSEKDPKKAETKKLDIKAIARVAEDFAPYLRSKSAENR
jgi:S1-C subfamily serine protease